MQDSNQILNEVTKEDYKYGFVTHIDTDVIHRGLDEETIRIISAKKQEENTPKTKIFLAMEIGCTPKMYLCKFNMILVYYLPISHPSWLR